MFVPTLRSLLVFVFPGRTWTEHGDGGKIFDRNSRGVDDIFEIVSASEPKKE